MSPEAVWTRNTLPERRPKLRPAMIRDMRSAASEAEPSATSSQEASPGTADTWRIRRGPNI